MAKRFGRNQRREMLALFKQLENEQLFGCAPAEKHDYDMQGIPIELKTFTVTDQYERGRVTREVTCEMIVRLDMAEGDEIYRQYANGEYFNIDGRRYKSTSAAFESDVGYTDSFRVINQIQLDRMRLTFQGVPRRDGR